MHLRWVVTGSLGEADRHEQDHWARHDLAGETECSETGEEGILGSRATVVRYRYNARKQLVLL